LGLGWTVRLIPSYGVTPFRLSQCNDIPRKLDLFAADIPGADKPVDGVGYG